MKHPLVCVYCRRPLKLIFGNANFGILSCVTHNYPVVDGILYLKHDGRGQKAVNLIRSGKHQRAVFTLYDLPRRMSIPAFLLLNKDLNISFASFIFIFKLFGYNTKWVNYLIKRKNFDSYKLFRLTVGQLKQGEKTLDFGCGVGQLLSNISRKVGSKNLVALDDFFLNLKIARKYFAKKDVLLVCGDGEQGLPFGNAYFKNIFATDSLHNITNKKLAIEEFSRTTAKNGRIFLIQIINSAGIVFGNIKGIPPEKLRAIVQRTGFKHTKIHRNSFFIKIPRNYFLDFKNNKFSKVKNKDEYSVFATKKI